MSKSEFRASVAESMAEIHKQAILELQEGSVFVSPYINQVTPRVAAVDLRRIPQSKLAFLFSHALLHLSLLYAAPHFGSDGGV